jgi:sRNA-binding protein
MSANADDAHVAQLLAETTARLQRLEATQRARSEAAAAAQRTLEAIRKQRHRAVPMWEAAQRAALRTVVLAVGCVMLITGAAIIDATFGGAAIIASLAILLVEGLR